jgi:hypothetical protein
VIFFFVLAGCASVSKIPPEAASQQFNSIEEKLCEIPIYRRE